MTGPKKILDVLKNSIYNVSSFLLPDVLKKKQKTDENSYKWSDNDDTVIIKRMEYESIQTDLFECEETIKKLNKIKNEKEMQIQEYEGMFTKFLKKKIEMNEIMPFSKSREDKISICKSNENRLRSHIQALKRDLIIAEERAERAEDKMEQASICYQKKIDYLVENQTKYKNEIYKLAVENEKSKKEIEDKCKKILELVEYCKHFTE